MKRRLTKKAYNQGIFVIDDIFKVKFCYFGRDTKAARYLVAHIKEVEKLASKEFE